MTEPTSDIVFGEEPEGPRYDWAGIAAKLRAKPMKWAKVFDKDSYSYAETIRQGALKAMPVGSGIEWRTRNNVRSVDPDTNKQVRTCTLFLRYNPERDSSVKTTTKRARKR